MSSITPLIPGDTDWRKVPLEVYKDAYNEAKAKHEDLLSESESITTKSIRILVLFFALIGWLGVNIKGLSTNAVLLIIAYCVVSIILLVKLMFLLFPKATPMRGTHPNRMFEDYKEFTKDADSDEMRTKAHLYMQITKYYKKIGKIVALNTSRQNSYKTALILSVFLVFGGALLYALRITAL